MHARRAAWLWLALLPCGALAGGAPRPAPSRPGAAQRAERSPLCTGDYADFFGSMASDARAYEASPRAGYTYCLRTIATYERVFYGKGGKLRREYLRHVRHGTGFAYQVKRGEWYVATNQHVADQPLVTEAEGDVESVPAGARKVREITYIVPSEADEDEGSHIRLTQVFSDEALDLAVLKTRHPLQVMPYRIGRSSALRVGNAVHVRGYPLGAFAASNTGRVISVGQPDRERNWNHEDFAVDALLNPGNSGSPVFAVSCRTGELELVGIYHAGYKDAQALNVVVSVDQLRDALETLKPTHREPADHLDRGALLARVRALPAPFVMPFADRAVRLDVDAGAVRFALLDGEFPLSWAVEAALVSRGRDLSQPSALAVPRRLGPREVPWSSLDGTLRDSGQRLYEALWRQLAAVLPLRERELLGNGEGRTTLTSVAARIKARRGEQREILQSIDFDAEDLLALAAPPAGNDAPMTQRADRPADATH